MSGGLAEAADRVVRHLRDVCQVPTGASIVAACSGGADSVMLVQVLHALHPEYVLERVLFVDHGVRDISSERASAHAAAVRANTPFQALTLDLEPGANLQARARAARYAALELATEAGVWIATGHTQTDQAETLLQRLLRGGGLRGQAGIKPVRGRIIRPLLEFSRAETRALARDFVEDPSNLGHAFQRNRLRHDVLPALRAEHPRAEEALARSATYAHAEHRLLMIALAHSALPISALKGHDRALFEAWFRANWPSGLRSSREHIERFAHAAQEGREHGPLRVDHEHLVAFAEGRIQVISEVDPRMQVVAPSCGAYALGDFEIVIKMATSQQLNHSEASAPRPVIDTWIDTSNMTWPIRIRRLPNQEAAHDAARFSLSDGSGRALAWRATLNRTRLPGRDLHVAVFVC